MLRFEPQISDLEVEAAAARDNALLTTPPRRLGIFFWVCVGWLVLLAIITAGAGLLPLHPPDLPISSSPNAAPWPSHWLLGTDEVGRDVLSRLIYGGRVSLVIGLAGTAIGITLGGTLGMLAAYVRGTFDAVFSFIMYCFLAFPAIIAVLCLLAFWGHNELRIIVVLGLFSVPFIFRVVRSATLACATKEYVTAARSQGATAWRVLAKDIFPNVIPSLIAYTVFTFGGIITTEGALGFLGQSVATPLASWGNMIGEASGDDLATLAYVLAPATALFLTLLALNYGGERLRLRFDTTEQKL